MVDKVCRFFASAVVFGVTFAGLVVQSTAQQPTEAQRDAIRSACRSDYMANCSSVTPGGIEALQCLQRNEGKLSGACRSAVNAIAASAKPAAAPAAAPAEQKPAATAVPAAPQKPATATAPVHSTPGTASAPAHNTPGTASAPAHGAPATHTPTTPPKATTPAPATAAAPASAPADTGPPPAPPPLPLAQIPPRFELNILRSCQYEHRSMCDLPMGDGRILNCLAANQASVSAGCSDALDNARAAAR